MFAALYHAHHLRHSEDLPFWEALARQSAGPILELGCGSGRVLTHLCQMGYEVIGLDISAEMLSFLLASSSGAETPVFQADMAAFHLARLFQLILLPCNTLSTLPPSVRRATFARVREHLHPCGVFAASVPNPLVLSQLPHRGETEFEESFPHPVDGEPVMVSSSWKRTARQVTFRWYYDHLLPDGLVERCDADVRHDLMKVEEYAYEMEAAGLQLVAQYGDFDRSPYGDESPYWIFLARRG